MSDVLHAFTKALALAKVYYNDTHKAHAMAMKANDAHSMEFLECCIWETVRSHFPFDASRNFSHTFSNVGCQVRVSLHHLHCTAVSAAYQ